ncbi:MAG: methionyl-tRNA formyltransferase [Phycisphaerales bacterium]|nr:methionyl-tRNA formyltransferase [Phycisphaerales bacterium]
MRLVFFGSSPFGLPTLERLCAEHALVGVVTQPDRPSGRERRLSPTPVGEFASRTCPGVPIAKPQRVRDAAGEIRGWNADAWVVIAYGQKLPRTLLEGVFAINLHASLLPRWRGAAPIHAAVMAGDGETGNSVIALADRMDAGEVFAREGEEIGPAQTTGDLHDLLAVRGAALVEGVLDAWARGGAKGEAQDESRATLAPKLSSADAWVDFSAPARKCRGSINGLSPAPGVRVQFRGAGLKLLRATEGPSGAVDAPGTVVDARDGLIACGEGTTLRLLEVQPADRRAMAWGAFVAGHRVERGETIVGGTP